MHRTLVQLLDWVALQAGVLSVRRPCNVPTRLAEANELLNRGGFLDDGNGSVPELKFAPADRFQFPSPVSTPAEESNIVHGRLHRCAGAWATRPAAILLHGWNDELGYRGLLPLVARRLVRAGVNAALFELPYHGRRRPRSGSAVRNFLSEDLLQVMLAIRQALADIHAIRVWLAAQGCPRVGLLGVSLGGWLGGLAACCDGRLAFAALLNPITRIDRAVAELAFCAPIRRALDGAKLQFDRLNLVSHRLAVPPGRVLMVESEHDMIAPPDAIEQLRVAWGGSEIWRVRHGHISALLSPSLIRSVVGWMAEKAGTEPAWATQRFDAPLDSRVHA